MTAQEMSRGNKVHSAQMFSYGSLVTVWSKQYNLHKRSRITAQRSLESTSRVNVQSSLRGTPSLQFNWVVSTEKQKGDHSFKHVHKSQTCRPLPPPSYTPSQCKARS